MSSSSGRGVTSRVSGDSSGGVEPEENRENRRERDGKAKENPL
jgi:adenosine/AMP kinase